MLVAALVALSVSTSLSLITHAQSAGPNINVLPIVLPTNASPSVFDAALVGDLFLQRQLEPAIAVSTRNPAHLLAFFNDYRAVDVDPSLDQGLGESQAGGAFNVAWTYVRQIFARLVGKPSPKTRRTLPEIAAAGVGEAWVGGSRSYDGGQTWSGMFLPGAPFDDTAKGLESPVKGLKGATDPVMAAGPCGKFYVAFLAYDRGGASKMAIATYQDLNNVQGGDTIEYQGTKVLESANNGQWGYFLDKPAIGLDPHRGSPSDPCGHNIYVSYTTFNGLSKDGKAQTKITLARSTNSGQTFSVGKLNQPYQQGQGTAIAVDPRETGGGTLYIAFRHFNDPDTILVHKSTNFGQTFSGQPMNLLAGSTTPTLQKYDQPTIATNDVVYQNPDHDLMFRALAFPTIAVTGDGTVMVAWTERVDTTTGRASDGGTPRIVLMQKAANSNTWTGINGDAQRLAIDVGERDMPGAAPPAGLGFLPQRRPSGPQIQPYLSFGAGKLMMLYYESRGFMTRPGSPEGETILPADLTPNPNFATGIDRLFDVRAALLHPSTGVVQGSAQVSRYPLKANADLTTASSDFATGETLDDVLPVYWPCAPDSPGATVTCERRVDRANKPTSRAGTSPFKGDYVGLTPAVQLVPRGDGSGWRWAINASDVPGRAFYGIFADNRNLVPPTVEPGEPEWARYAHYVPPFASQCSVNGGSRNTDVFVSKIDGDVVVTVPTTYTQLQNIQRTFPIVVSSSAATPRYFRLTFSDGGGIASFRQETDLDKEEILVHPFSSATRVAYAGECHVENGVQVCTSTAASVTVRVQEIDEEDGDVIGEIGTVTLNGDSSNPPVINDGIANTELHNPDIGAPDIGAPDIGAPDIGAPDIGAPDIGAPDIGAPDIGAPDIGASAPTDYVSSQDITWTLTNTGNTNSAYTASVHLDNPEQYGDDYAFQLIIHKTGTFGSLYNCESFSLGQSRIISIIANPDIGAPDIGAPDIGAPDIGAPDIGAATFAMGPSDSAPSSGASNLSANRLMTEAAAPAATNDGTLKAPKASETVKVTLRAYQMTNNPAVIFDPTLTPPAVAIAQQSKNNVNGVLQNLGVAVQGADLRVSSAPAVQPSSGQVGTSVSVGPWTIQNFGNVAAIPVEDEDGDGKINNSVYLSPTDPKDFRRNNPAYPNFNPGDIKLGPALDASPLAAATITGPATAQVGVSTVTILAGTPPGDYYLFVVADDGSQSVTGEVNELNEINNASDGAVFKVTAVNTAPVANDDSRTTSEDTLLTIAAPGVLANDTDLENPALTAVLVAGPSHGTLTLNANGSFTYTPAADYNGPDSFSYKANDGSLDSIPATVSITVTAVNDAPVANPQTKSVVENTATPITLTAADIDSAVLTYSIVTGPTHGTLSPISGTSPNVTYTPASNYEGPDSFTFRAYDGSLYSAAVTVSITVTPGIDQYGFIRLLTLLPSEAPPKFKNLGSSIPLGWQYTLGGVVVNTSTELPKVTFTKMNATNNACTSPSGEMQQIPGGVVTYLENTDFPGNSSFQYNTTTNTWQFNWQTVPPVTAGCWNVRVILPRPGGSPDETRQVNGPFPLRLR